MTEIMKLCAADFYNTDDLYVEIFGFRETKVFKSKINSDGEEKSAYAIAGYDSSNYFVLLGPILFLIVLYAVGMLVKKIL